MPKVTPTNPITSQQRKKAATIRKQHTKDIREEYYYGVSREQWTWAGLVDAIMAHRRECAVCGFDFATGKPKSTQSPVTRYGIEANLEYSIHLGQVALGGFEYALGRAGQAAATKLAYSGAVDIASAAWVGSALLASNGEDRVLIGIGLYPTSFVPAIPALERSAKEQDWTTFWGLAMEAYYSPLWLDVGWGWLEMKGNGY
jgi:hypothetical protein